MSKPKYLKSLQKNNEAKGSTLLLSKCPCSVKRGLDTSAKNFDSYQPVGTSQAHMFLYYL